MAFMATMFFHYSNKMMLNIGVFPYFMVAISFIYFEPDWPLTPIRMFRNARKRLSAHQEDDGALLFYYY